ncbi:MAG: hypothetical protein B7Y81_16340 [Caulobacter sp. 32-67-35]|nr:MAG: hypothetical protein B7Y81_16340 [Caulobacter sp. 32-67-35]HQR90190.1 hypothetical protein [Caulobacter sp.]
MRRLLVLFALVGLLYSPAAAVASQQTCVESGMPMAGMATAASENGKAVAGAPVPCCDHKSKAHDNKACAQACAVMGGVVGALPTAVLFVPPQIEGQPVAEVSLPLKPHPPPRTERPPRSIV